MPTVGIVGSNEREISSAVSRISGGRVNCHAVQKPQKTDVLIAAEARQELREIAPLLSEDSFIAVNADNKRIFGLIGGTKAKIITYGFNRRACITASSVTDSAVQICVQRGFVGADGKEREIGEFSVAVTGENTESILGAVSACMILHKSSYFL